MWCAAVSLNDAVFSVLNIAFALIRIALIRML